MHIFSDAIFNRSFWERYGLIFILALFITLTITGIFYNYSIPHTIGDETVLMSATLKMIAEFSLRPNYPTMYHMPFGTYIYLPFFIVLLAFLRLLGVFTSIDELRVFGITDYEKLLPMARFVSVLLSAASVYIVYSICEKLFNNKFVSLTASFLLATNLLFVQMSHFGKVWLPQVFIIMLAFYFITLFYQKERPAFKDYFYPALLTGISFGTHFIGVLVYLPFLAVHYLKNKGRTFREIFITNKNFWSANLIVIVVLLLVYYLNPYGFKNYGTRSLTSIANIFNQGVDAGGSSDFWPTFVYYGEILFEYGPALTVIFILSLIPLFLRERGLFLILNSFIFVYYLMIGPLLGPTIGINGRGFYVLPIIPFMAMVAAFGINVFYQGTFIGKKIKVFLLAAFFLFSLYPPILLDYILMRPSTLVLTRDWIQDNLSSGSRIVNFDTSIPINENRESMEDVKMYTPNFLTKKQDYLLSVGNNKYPKPNYYVFTPPNYRDGMPQAILDKGFDYLVVSWWDHDAYIRIMQSTRQFHLKEEDLIKIFPAGATSNTFSMDLEGMRQPLYNLRKINYTGPVVAIYKLNK